MAAATTAAAAIADAAWKATDSTGILVVQWETDNSVFNRDTGETHLLGELPVMLLRCVSDTPRGLAWISAYTAKECEIENDEAWQRKIAHTLGALEDLELIQRLPRT